MSSKPVEAPKEPEKAPEEPRGYKSFKFTPQQIESMEKAVDEAIMARTPYFQKTLNDPVTYEERKKAKMEECDLDRANLIGSLQDMDPNEDEGAMHLPIFDFDYPIAVVPSSTPGHYHLYLSKPLEWGTYKLLLQAFAQHNLLQHAWVNRAITDRTAALRLPGHTKPPPIPPQYPSAGASRWMSRAAYREIGQQINPVIEAANIVFDNMAEETTLTPEMLDAALDNIETDTGTTDEARAWHRTSEEIREDLEAARYYYLRGASLIQPSASPSPSSGESSSSAPTLQSSTDHTPETPPQASPTPTTPA